MSKRKAKKPEPLGDVTLTGRGFDLIEFTDRYGEKCSLQESSLAERVRPGTSAVWLGVNCDDARMHLSRAQVESLIAHLNSWLKRGTFRIGGVK